MSPLIQSQRSLLAPAWAGYPNELWRRAKARPSLDLRFADNKSLVDATTGQNLVTFTRASSGTYVDSQGVIRTATTNLQRHSEDFTQGLTPNNATLTANQGIAPNGIITADQFLETTANGLHNQEIVDHVFIAGATYTFSCYAKSIGERNFAPGFPTLFSSARFGFFNLSGSGSVVSTNAGVTASIQAVGDGWYRCSITSTCVTGGGARVGVFIASGTSISYVGDAAKGLLLWGAQLEQSSTVGEYIPTTSTINSAPRFDHNPTTGESLGLLVEEQRTNLLLKSEQFDDAVWLTSASYTSVTPNSTISPDGTQTADTLVFTAGSGFFYQTVAVSASTSYTYSFFRKVAGLTKVAVYDASNAAWITQDAPVVSTQYANGWEKVSYTFTTPVGCTSIRVYPERLGGGDRTIIFWGAQLEAGAFPTSYIPTTTATVTRSADVTSITGSNFSSRYQQDEGTVFAEAATLIASQTQGIVVANDNSSNNRVDMRLQGSTLRLIVTDNGVTSVSTQSVASVAANTFFKAANAYKTDDFASCFNAATPVLDTLGTVPIVNRFVIGGLVGGSSSLNGTIRRLTYFPIRLANEVLQRITQ